MGQIYPHFTRWLGNIVVVPHIYGDLVISRLFFDHQDAESESRDIKIGISGPILTQKQNQIIYGTMISILYKMGEKNCGNSSYLWS